MTLAFKFGLFLAIAVFACFVIAAMIKRRDDARREREAFRRAVAETGGKLHE